MEREEEKQAKEALQAEVSNMRVGLAKALEGLGRAPFENTRRGLEPASVEAEHLEEAPNTPAALGHFYPSLMEDASDKPMVVQKYAGAQTNRD